MRDQLIDRCVTHLTFLLRHSPELTSYKLEYDYQNHVWMFTFTVRDGREIVPVHVEEGHGGPATLDWFKETLGRLFR